MTTETKLRDLAMKIEKECHFMAHSLAGEPRLQEQMKWFAITAAKLKEALALPADQGVADGELIKNMIVTMKMLRRDMDEKRMIKHKGEWKWLCEVVDNLILMAEASVAAQPAPVTCKHQNDCDYPDCGTRTNSVTAHLDDKNVADITSTPVNIEPITAPGIQETAQRLLDQLDNLSDDEGGFFPIECKKVIAAALQAERDRRMP